MCASTHPPLLLFTAFLKCIWVFTSIKRGFLVIGLFFRKLSHFFRKLSPTGFPEIWVHIPLVSEESSWISWVAEVAACGSFKVVGTMWVEVHSVMPDSTTQAFHRTPDPGPAPRQRMTPSSPPMAQPNLKPCLVTRTPSDTGRRQDGGN